MSAPATEEIRFEAKSGTLVARFVPPQGASTPTGVLVLPGAAASEPGAFAQRATERLARAGHAVLVPELRAQGDRATLNDLDHALAELRVRAGAEADDVAVLGAESGGTHAFLLGCHSRDVAACVCVSAPVVYPVLDAARPMQPLEMALNLSCPLLALYGEEDADVPPEQRAQLTQVLSQFARDFDIVTYPGVGPRFLDRDVDEHAPDAVDDAWGRILSFLSSTFSQL